MLLCYSIAKESKYSKDDDGNYINGVIGILVEGKETNDESIRSKVAREKLNWVASQINVLPFFLIPITKEKFDNFK